MAKARTEIIADVTNYVRDCGGEYSDWYAGIAATPQDRLFNDHGVQEKGDSWIYRECSGSETARGIEEYFLDRGMDGGTGGGDATTKYVYAYRKSAHSRE